FLAPGDERALLEQELAAAERAGVPGVQLLIRSPAPRLADGPCLRFPRQAQFHPLRYVAALARAIAARGGRVHGMTHASAIERGTPARVATAGGPTVTADAIVVATNTPVHLRFAIHTKQAAYRSYVIAARVAPDAVPPALYWDTGDPYHYVRLTPA